MNRERLEKLMKGLELQATDESWDYKFRFNDIGGQYRSVRDTGRLTPGCGFLGCALGHLPLIFPERFACDVAEAMPISVPEAFFGISRAQVAALFVDPDGRKWEDITRFDIADRIRRLLANPNAKRDEIVGLR